MDGSNTKINKKLSQTNSLDEFYSETAILVTGATGFVGKGILEKLLRICPRIAAIFLLMRPKRNKTMEERFKKLTDDPVFDYVKAEHGSSIFSKVHPIQGDVNLLNLGLSSEDRIMITENVNIIFHLAATVTFNKPLDEAVNTNAKGSNRVIDLCKELNHLISFVHVSTAYSNAPLSDVEENVYTTKWEPSAVIDICDKHDKTSITLLEEEILETFPNTYTFTKNLAEQIVFRNCKRFPAAIVRPSIIGASLEQPCPGWVDNLYGTTGIFLQIGKGNVKVLRANKDMKADIVPVDYVVDTIICAAWHVAIHPNNDVKVYNCTSNADSVSWGYLTDTCVECCVEAPMNNILWYPFCKIVHSRFLYHNLNILLHVFPAFIMDIALRLRGERPIMMKINKYYNQVLTVLVFFLFHEWSFRRDNVYKMAEDIKVLKDSNKMRLDLREMIWKPYTANYNRGIAKFILKEESDPIQAARQLSMFYWVHNITLLLCAAFFLIFIVYICYMVIDSLVL